MSTLLAGIQGAATELALRCMRTESTSYAVAQADYECLRTWAQRQIADLKGKIPRTLYCEQELLTTLSLLTMACKCPKSAC
jgi:hypothetical protein